MNIIIFLLFYIFLYILPLFCNGMSYKDCLNKDIEYGNLKAEGAIKDIEKYLKARLKKTKGKYNVFDYVNKEDKIYVEIKSRKNERYRYPTTMVGANKFYKAKKLYEIGNVIYFFFLFTDALCFYEYDPADGDKYEIKTGGRYDRGKVEQSQYVYIPVEDLVEI